MKYTFSLISALLSITACASITALADGLSLASSSSPQTALDVTYSNPSIVGSALVVTIQIQNTSGTWVYIEEDTTSPPTGIPYTVYLLGPGGTKVFQNVSFESGSYLKFSVTTPVGLDYTSLDPKCRALFGALTVDYLMRGLLTTPLPADAFDNITGAIDPLLDSVVSSLGTVGQLATAVKERDYVGISSALAQMALNSVTAKDAISQLLQKYVTSSQVDNFFTAASGTLASLLQILDVSEKIQLLNSLTVSTFRAPTQTWNRFDLAVTSQTPVVNYVIPQSLLTSPNVQPLQILGSGFTSSSTLLFNGSIPSDGARLHFKNANEIDYDIIVQSAGTWWVQVVNGAQPSNSKNFSVNNPPPTSGSLVVNLSPAGMGAQWQVDGTGYENSGQVVGYLTPGSHTVTFKPVSGYTTPAGFSVNILAGQQTATNATYIAISPSTYTLTLNYNTAQGTIRTSPPGGGYVSGSLVQLTAFANSGYHFVNWSGDISGSVNPANITMSADKSITANFASGDPNLATIIVTIKPSPTVDAGAQWKLNSTDWLDSGTPFNTSLLNGNYNYLQFKPVSGWITPKSFYVNVSGGQTTNVVVTYQQDMTPGLLTVTLSPPEAVTAGAHWHVNGGTYGNGASASLTPGDYTVTFDAVAGWTAPASQSVTIQPSGTKIVSAKYTPPDGQPVISSISPPIAPMTGGTLLTINGANFTAPATVLVGDQPASNVVIASPTQITCLTPPSTNYGSAKVVVQTGGGSATSLNGFSYGFTNGNKIDLVSAIGGSCFTATVQGDYAYIGEGRNMLVLDVSSPTAPSKIGQVLLPGVVRGIALFGHYAYVAAQEGGVQVVDISNPAIPAISGSFQTDDYTFTDGIAIFGGLAYVANENLGLLILDLAKPTVPTLVSSTNIGGGEAVLVKASANGVYAYVSTGGGLSVVDVSSPASPGVVGQTPINSGSCYSIAMTGNYVFAASRIGNLQIVDVSNPSSPINFGNAPDILYAASVGVANGYVYAASALSGVGFYVFSLNGATLTQVGHLSGFSGDGYNMALNGTTAYLPDRAAGVRIVRISNPTVPVLLTTFGDSGVFRQYDSVAVTQHSMAACGSPHGTITGFNTIFDVSNPFAPVFASDPNTGGSMVLARNGIAYVLESSSNFTFNITTPSSPQLLKMFSNGMLAGKNMVLAGNVLHVVGISGGSQPHWAAIDVSTPSAPVISGTKDFTEFSSGVATSVAVAGTKALVGVQTYEQPNQNEVIGLDISNLSSPNEGSSYSGLPSYPIAIELSPDGDFAYILGGGNPGILTVLNSSQSAVLSLVTNIQLDTSLGTGLAINANELLATTFRGLYAFDITDPAAPKLTHSYPLSAAQSVSVTGDAINQSGTIYVADLDGGLVVLREQDTQAPSVFISNPTFFPIYTNSSSTINLGGGSDDNTGVTSVIWSNDRGGSGSVNAPFDNWFLSNIALYPGTNHITVTAYDAAGNAGSKTLTVIYPTPKQGQTITFPSIADRVFGAPPVTLAATASSGLPVAFSVVSGPAIISGNVLTITGAGPVTVEADQSGDDFFTPATPVDQSFNVLRADQSIDFATLLDKSAGDPPFELSAASSSGLPVSFSLLSGPASIGGDVVTLFGGGTVTVLAWQPGNSNYNAAATVQRSFDVSKIPQTITFGPLSPQKLGDAPFQLNASASSGLPVSLSTAGPAMLDGNILTLTGWGTVTVTATQSGNNSYTAAVPVVQSLAVAPADNTLIGLGLQGDTGFQMAYYGILNSNYTFQASSNLLDWQDLTNLMMMNSPVYISDPAATNLNQRFYRAVTP